MRRLLAGLLKRRRGGFRIDRDAPWRTPHHTEATAEDIFYCFRLFLGRSPNREEWQGHAAFAGGDLDAVVRSYVSSLEFSRRADTMRGHRLSDRVSLARLEGFSIYVQTEDAAVGQLVKRDAYEPHVSSVFRDRLRPGMHVLDVGANIGYFTMLAASLVGPSGSVTAIEPNADSARLLEASRRANSFDNVTVIQVAAGRELGLLVLNTSYSNAMTSATPEDPSALIGSTTVPSFRIDELIPRTTNIELVKIDVEGAEYNALLGASDLLTRCHPTILSEFSPYTMPGISGCDGREYLRFLLSFGYRISVVEQSGALTECGVDPEKVMSEFAAAGVDHIDLLLD